MKKLLFIITLLCCSLLSNAQVTDIREQLSADTWKATGVYAMYDFAAPLPSTPPKGYEPFLLSHYGRHGARFVTSNARYDGLFEVLSKAHEKGILTEFGENLYAKYAELYPFVRNHAGELTRKGQEQHLQLSRRMYDTYKKLFRSAQTITASSSVVPRCIMSMSSFCEGLIQCDDRLKISKTASPADMYMLNPYSKDSHKLSKDDANYLTTDAQWQKSYVDYRSQTIDTKPIMQRIFVSQDAARELCRPMRFVIDLYAVVADMQCLDVEGVDFSDVFTADEMFALWECENIIFYMQEGPGFEGNGRMSALTVDLLRNIVDNLEKEMDGEKPTVRLRFGHDMTIMGLLSLLNVPEWSTQAKTYSDIKYYWQNWRVPMGSNMQFVLYKSKKGEEPLVRLLYNESPAVLPLEEKHEGGFYSWNDFLAYSMEIIRKADAVLASESCNFVFSIPHYKEEKHPMQAFSIHKDVVFVCFDAGYCQTYNLKSGKLIGDFRLGSFIKSNHCGNANLGTQYPEGNTEFPALYVSGDLTNKSCYVESVSKTCSRLIQTIKFELDNEYGGSQAIIDNERGRIVYMQRQNKKITYMDNKFMMYEFPIPDINAGDITYTDADILESYELSCYEPLYQGAVIRDGMLYLAHGLMKDKSGSAVGLAVYDMKTKELVKNLDFTPYLKHEPQSVCIYKDKLYMNFINRGLYEITNIK